MQAQRSFEAAIAGRGEKAAFLENLSEDAVIFRPKAVNGKEFWRSHEPPAADQLVRKAIFTDIAANGLMGYTTGNWRLYQKGKSEALAKFGQFVTVWERKPDGRFRITLDVTTSHEKLLFADTDRVGWVDRSRDLNERGWSPADASMNFLKMSMGVPALGGAYERFGGKDIRLLRDGMPPILGRDDVVAETNQYISIEYPKTVTMYQSADMAYFWNPCSYASSREGMEDGTCLHILKLRDKKWWITLGAIAKVPNPEPPVLRVRQGRRD